MKAVFVRSQAVLRDSHALTDGEDGSPRLVPATLEAMRQLSNGESLVVLYGHYQTPDESLPAPILAIIQQVEAAAGRIDIAVCCAHAEDTDCQCWGDTPGIIWSTARQFGLDLPNSFLVGDCATDVLTAKAAGVRPILVLGERSIEEVLGSIDVEKDFGFAPDLPRAAEFIAIEQEISSTVGSPRQQALEVPADYAIETGNRALPRISAISALARQTQQRRSGTRVQLGDLGRWLVFLTIGGLGLSLGIAYMLTHLYRVQAFPAFVGTLTLQFIDRRVRGAIFLALGVVFVFLAARSIIKTTHGDASGTSPKRSQRRRRA